ncbi:synaptonemal complex protein 2 isoform X1 [Lepisosteus oculatus]|uniref:synaptonemal complex protein 2 isoform X1 n=1 Tax=Lepisosteus oculatus TaxID=7918 RepID=UPI0035F5216D
MPPHQDQQFEKCIDEALKKNEFHGLGKFLQDKSNEGTSQKCSKQLINKLDQLMNREIDKRRLKNASQLLCCLQKLGKSLRIQGSEGIAVMLKQGLVNKMVQWFDKAREIWAEGGHIKNENLLNFAEDFFDFVMAVHENSNEGKSQVTKTFLHRAGQLTADAGVHISIQQEAVRKLNQILDESPHELKRQVLSSAEILSVMKLLGKRIMEGGDYDLQVALTEALCRMTTEKQRHELADGWFSVEFVAKAFKRIKDSEFETDCRKFLNLINGMQGDRRRVYSYPCLEVFLDKHELFMPADDKLEEFWIDFNLGSQSITFYISTADGEEENQWDTVCIPKDEVEYYTVKEEKGQKVLTVILKQLLNSGGREGNKIQMYFSAALDIGEAVRHVYGEPENKRTVGKCSVVKTIVHYIETEDGSQVLVPESQVSQTLSTVQRPMENENKITQLPPHSVASEERSRSTKSPQHTVQSSTPMRWKVSEASSIISYAGDQRATRSPASTVMATPTASKDKVKPALQLIGSSKINKGYNINELITTTPSRQPSVSKPSSTGKDVQDLDKSTTTALENSKRGSERASSTQKFLKHIPVTKVVEMVQEDKDDVKVTEEEYIDDMMNVVPDTQPFIKKDKPLLSDPVFSVSRERNTISRKMSEGVSPAFNGVSSSFRIKDQNDSSLCVLKQDQAQQLEFSMKKPPSSTKHSSTETNYKDLQKQVTEKLERLLKEKNQRAGDRCLEVNGSQVHREQPAERGARVKAAPAQEKDHSSAEACTKPSFPAPAKQAEKAAPVLDRKPSTFSKDSSFRKQGSSQSTKETEVSERRTDQRKTISVMKRCIDVTETTTSISGKCRTVTGQGLDTSLQKRSHLEKSWSFSFTEKGILESPGLMKSSSHSKQTKKTAVPPEDDIYSFRDDSIVKCGEGERTLPKRSETKKRETEDSRNKFSSLEKSKEKKPRGCHVKKHLFSDTDTDRRTEDSRTDISWLRESSRRPKPKVKNYSRHPCVKPPLNPQTYESPDLTPCIKKPLKDKPRKKKSLKETVQNAQMVPNRQSGRPQRAAAQNQNYKDLSESDTMSESQGEEEAVRKPIQQQVNRNMTKKVKTVPPLEKNMGQKESQDTLAPSFSSLSSPPLSIEKMRCVAKSVDKSVVFTGSPIPPLSTCTFTTLYSSPEKIPEPHKGIHPKPFYRADKNREKAPPQPLVKSLNYTYQEPDNGWLEFSTISGPVLAAEDDGQSEEEVTQPARECRDSQDLPISFEKESVLSIRTNSRSSVKSLTDKDALSTGIDNKSCSPRLQNSAQVKVLMSGPSVTPCATLKRLRANQSTSSSEEEDEEETRRKEPEIKIRPTKLFKSADADHWAQNDIELQSTTFSHTVSTPDFSTWSMSLDQDMMCQKFTTKQKTKLQDRSKKMDYFARQSLKTVQQHVSSVHVQVKQHRFRNLDRFRDTILEELNDFEKDVSTLKNMEKDLTNFWKKQSQVLCTYQEQEQKRIHLLKSSFKTNVANSQEYEERILTTEMHLLRKDIKLIQDRLLKEMHQEELLSVHRGLQALFFPETSQF